MQIAGATDLAAVLEQLLRALRRSASAGGLSAPAASVLATLDRDGPQRLTDLAAREAVSQPGMTQLVGRLERHGLVRRQGAADDRRVVRVAVTDAGRAVVAQRRGERAAVTDTWLRRLDAADRAAIRRALPALARLAHTATIGDTRTAGTADPA